jgi:sugar lactone lactonase YvrE
MDSGLFPNGIAVSPDDAMLAIGDFRAGRMWYAAFTNGPTMGCPQCPKDPLHLTFAGVKAGTYVPGNSGPDGIHYDVRGNLWAQLAGLGGIVEIDPRGIILGFVPIPNGERNDQLRLTRRRRQPVHLRRGGNQRDLLAFQGALSRPDRPGGCALAGTEVNHAQR